jgi:4-amino-4-deoxy-L-arabinose transferase-like glycosyltransferase
MLERFNHRGGHVLLLCFVWACVTLPNLGTPSLWDVDEGNNSEAAYEMRESESLIVPTFDYQMRVDKPALLYWLQVAAYRVVGVNELAARLPSALAALAAILLTYELGRRTFGPIAGLLGGIILASAALFCASSHFANPDALLDTFTLLALFVFWRAYRADRPLPFALAGAISGLGMLTKGPVGLVLPVTVAIVFLGWQRELRRLLDVRFGWGVLTFLLVAAPWYTWVGVETKGQWLAGFFVKHNVERALAPMENHDGWFIYYAVVLLVGFAPWSAFFVPGTWDATARVPGSEDRLERSAVRFLLCWIAVYVAFFTMARTKLPNYILPIYPAVALLTARSLDRWRRALAAPPRWMMPTSLISIALIGPAAAIGLLIASGTIPAGVPAHRQLPALASLAWIGGVPVVSAAAAWFVLKRGSRQGAVAVIASGSVLFTTILAAAGPVAVDRYKAPRALCAALPADQEKRELRIGAYDYFQPSLVFYCRREVSRIANEAELRSLLEGPLPGYVFLPAKAWQNLRARTAAVVIARHYDLYDGCDIVLVTNERPSVYPRSAVARSTPSPQP